MILLLFLKRKRKSLIGIKKLKDMLASVEQANINLEKEKESDVVERKHLFKQSEDLKDES